MSQVEIGTCTVGRRAEFVVLFAAILCSQVQTIPSVGDFHCDWIQVAAQVHLPTSDCPEAKISQGHNTRFDGQMRQTQDSSRIHQQFQRNRVHNPDLRRRSVPTLVLARRVAGYLRQSLEHGKQNLDIVRRQAATVSVLEFRVALAINVT